MADVAIEALLDAFASYLRVERGLSRNTVESYGRDLTSFGEFLEARGIRDFAARQIRFRFAKAPQPGRIVLTLTDVSKDYGKGKLFDIARLELERGFGFSYPPGHA